MINADSEALVGWSTQYGLELNAGKTSDNIIGSPHNLSALKKIDLNVLTVDDFSIVVRDFSLKIS